MTSEELIRTALATHYTEWYSINHLIEIAEDEITRDHLIAIRNAKYHEEEYYGNR